MPLLAPRRLFFLIVQVSIRAHWIKSDGCTRRKCPQGRSDDGLLLHLTAVGGKPGEWENCSDSSAKNTHICILVENIDLLVYQ